MVKAVCSFIINSSSTSTKKAASVSQQAQAETLLKKAKHLTPFQRKVYQRLCQVPAGKVTTYGLLAEAVSCRSAQAVGQALKRNPLAPAVPCHRVVDNHGGLGGFGGTRHGSKLDRKKAMLLKEGVVFSQEGLVDTSCICQFT
jgi:methylated-DNA-[protein]-cysteine S-methyltransferase